MKIGKTFILLFVLLVGLDGSIIAQKTWEKPFVKWSKTDALKIVSDSPWAQTYQSPEGSSAAAALQSGRAQRDNVNGGGNDPHSSARFLGPPAVVIRLHSGVPIRQAIIRGRQIESGYDKMDETKKSDFDNSSKGFLDCAICKNYYVVSVTQFPDASGQAIEEGIFQRLTLKDLKGNVWLISDRGEKRELVQFTPPKGRGDSAFFFFARKDDTGNLLVTSENKDFKFEFNNDFFHGGNPYASLVPRRWTFKVSPLVADNVVIF